MIDWLSHNAPMIGLLFFFIFFVLMALWLYRPGAKGLYQSHASIPLEESKDE